MSEKLWSQLSRLREISEAIQNRKPLDDNDTQYLASALRKVFEGCDANTAFDVKGGKGQSRSLKERKAADNKAMALGWVAEAMRPEDDSGLGLSEAEACYQAEEHFGINSETLQTYRGNKKNNRDPYFDLALSRVLKC
jgi:hypothetical protein